MGNRRSEGREAQAEAQDLQDAQPGPGAEEEAGLRHGPLAGPDPREGALGRLPTVPAEEVAGMRSRLHAGRVPGHEAGRRQRDPALPALSSEGGLGPRGEFSLWTHYVGKSQYERLRLRAISRSKMDLGLTIMYLERLKEETL